MRKRLELNQKSMKKRIWRTLTLPCVLLFLLLLAFQIKCSSFVTFNWAPRKTTPETERDMIEFELNTSTQGTALMKEMAPPPRQITCDRSHYAYDICTIHVETTLNPTTSTFFIQHPTTVDPNQTATKIRPYPRKFDGPVMSRIKELTITAGTPTPSCHVKHEDPALVFSAGGYTGNFFHDFNDGFIPLFITLNSFFHDKDAVLVISKARDWWVNKYATLLREFSKHPIVDLDNDNKTHCFPDATLGLVSHGFMTIKPELMRNPKSLHDFHAFLRKTYGANDNNVSSSSFPRPRLVLLNRSGGDGRLLLNMEEVKLEMQRVGFNVIVFEPTATTPLSKAFEVVGSSHAMVGIHGAALTHSLFLKPGCVLIQVVPLGLESVAEMCFGKVGEMGLKYMEYRVRVEESSLVEKYDREDVMIKKQSDFVNGRAWNESTMNVYLKEQNLRLDLVRFRKYLKKAYNNAKQLIGS
ncbi:alpha-1,3-arabinosyltransferase XAT3-like isoform X2 [Vigna unguiculata]|uniref:alpha-1,3-arabinosyltransferase XAT3-like isoform X2 n=1 Tax=Vigna unguiculata TaxID=3917 RepID=UPI001016536F|nr:alpha-1,3-arabinosyltransferase XAT3-like isoform X2 [Vigna unguiculata]